MIRLACRALGVQVGKALGWNALIRPFIAHLTLTNRCNLRCSMCNMWAMSPKEDLPPSVLHRLRASRLWPGIRILDLTGGEPFLVDVASVVETLRTENIQSVYLTTNGVLTRHILEQTGKILQSKGGFRLFIGVSLDGPNEVHDRLRGLEGTYRRAIETLEGLALMAQDHSRLHISIKYTIMPENWQYIRKTFDIAQSRGFGFTAKPYLLSGILGNTGEVQFSPEQISSIERQINQIDEAMRDHPVRPFQIWRGIAKHADRMFHRELIGYLKNYYLKGKTRGLYPCDSSFISVMVHCDGKIYSCPKLMKPVGDLREHTLEFIWDSVQAREVRRFIQSGACACFSQCDLMPSLLLRSKAWMAFNIFRELAVRG
ncbi:MAG: radical SAM protein [Deltaproteobacteria bacterium]|nr:radical SAM protein [Deltaproteobacteria bacterium]